MARRGTASDTIASRLIALREAAGLTPYRLAQLSGVSKQTLSAVEAGKSQPAFSTVAKLAKALDVSLSAFDGLEK